MRLFNELCHEVNVQSGALLPLLEKAGIEGYEMQSKIMKNFSLIIAAQEKIAAAKAKDKK